jgi:heme-degrading monooxygenase HmoA
VLVWYRAPAADQGALFDAYHRVSHELAGTPGLLGNELLRSPVDPTRLAVCSEWESLAAFRAWESGADHRGTTAPLRQYQDPELPSPFDLLGVVAEHRSRASALDHVHQGRGS